MLDYFRNFASVVATSILILLPGCFAPVNLTHDNAKMLIKNEMKAQAGFSGYYGPKLDLDDNHILEFPVHYTNNLGVSAAYGLSGTFNLGLRYEYLDIKQQHIQILSKSYDMQSSVLHYFELSGKIGLIEDDLALGLPVGLYYWKGKTLTMIDPRIYYTLRRSNKLEFNAMAKVHILIADGISLAPGISLGVGLSTDLNRWALRPEAGFDGCLSFGFGIDYRFNKPRN